MAEYIVRVDEKRKPSGHPSDPKKFYGLNECADCEHFCSYCGARCENVPDHQGCMMPCFVPSWAVMLAEVARDMYAALHINEHCSMEFIADKGDCETFRARIEALGVSLDG